MDSNYLTWINLQYIMYILSLWNTNGLYMGCKIASYPAITTGQKQRLFTFTLRWHHGSSRSIRGESRGIFTKLRCILTDQKSWLPSTNFSLDLPQEKGGLQQTKRMIWPTEKEYSWWVHQNKLGFRNLSIWRTTRVNHGYDMLRRMGWFCGVSFPINSMVIFHSYVKLPEVIS